MPVVRNTSPSWHETILLLFRVPHGIWLREFPSREALPPRGEQRVLGGGVVRSPASPGIVLRLGFYKTTSKPINHNTTRHNKQTNQPTNQPTSRPFVAVVCIGNTMGTRDEDRFERKRDCDDDDGSSFVHHGPCRACFYGWLATTAGASATQRTGVDRKNNSEEQPRFCGKALRFFFGWFVCFFTHPSRDDTRAPGGGTRGISIALGSRRNRGRVRLRGISVGCKEGTHEHRSDMPIGSQITQTSP